MRSFKKSFPIAIAVIILFTGFMIFDDPIFIRKMKNELDQFQERFPEEKVYVQLDKTLFKPGEDIWFNSFILNGNTHKPTHTSDVIYVELIDPKGSVIQKRELFIENGSAWGDFSTEEDIAGGIYTLKAYTLWMKNFKNRSEFTKTLTIQKVVSPRILMKLDFEKEAYGPGDPVRAELSLRNLKDEKIRDTEVEFSVSLKGSEILRSKAKTDKNGEVILPFDLPKQLETSDGLLQVLVEHNGLEESISRSIPIVLEKITLEFFPEGGSLISGRQSTIGFKALNEYSKGADVKCTLLDEVGNEIEHFESFHMGMGAFEFNPEKGKQYFARIDVPSGNDQLISLPNALHSGISMQLKEKNRNNVIWEVFTSHEEQIYLTGRTHGVIQHSSTHYLKEGKNIIKVNTRDFPMGIGVFTLFNGQELEVAERLVFLNPDKVLNIEITPHKEDYKPEEKVELLVKTTDKNGNPVSSKFSIAVVDDQLISYADDKQDNILSSMMLSSELKGEIQEPSFYFDPEEEKAEKAMDYLLMTQGWRGFTLKEIIESEPVITYNPEKLSNLIGRVVDFRGNPLKTEVTLMESTKRKRMVSVTTTDDGRFMFKNIDASIPNILLTPKPGEILVQGNLSKTRSITSNSGSTRIIENIPETVETDGFFEFENKSKDEFNPNNEGVLDLAMTDDVSQLSEVVVTALGISRKSQAIGYTVLNQDIPSTNLVKGLQGKVAGVNVVNVSGNLGSSAKVQVRGVSTLSNGGEPLYVVNGVPMDPSISNNFTEISMVSPSSLESVTVISSPDATALYGSRAANGVILLTTKSDRYFNNYSVTQKESKFYSIVVNPRKFSISRVFYAPPPEAKKKNRTESRSTIHWMPNVFTDEDGEAEIEFYNSQEVSAFRMIAEGHTSSGLIGRSEKVYSTRLPISIASKLPEYLGYEDVARIPVIVTNDTDEALKTTVKVSIPEDILMEEDKITDISIDPNTSKTLWYTLKPNNISGEFTIDITASAGRFEDNIQKSIVVKPVGYPVEFSYSGKEMKNNFELIIKDVEEGTLTGSVKIYPDVVGDLLTGAESILRRPSGCFEQVSSSTFPNILVLQYLKETRALRPEIEQLALKYIDEGYKKLTGYEIKGGGFEWFGNPPAHEGLTAFGLLEFHEMSKIYPKVNAKMMERTRDWLLSRKNGFGGFNQREPWHGFSNDRTVTNAYILFALSETGTLDIEKEYQKALSKSWENGDMYALGLLANTAFNMNKLKDYKKLVEHFRNEAKGDGISDLKATHSITHSYGNSLQVETVSIWASALMKRPFEEADLINRCIRELAGSRNNGYFGSTQANTMALRALSQYAMISTHIKEDGELIVHLDDSKILTVPFTERSKDVIHSEDLGSRFSRDRKQNLSIEFREVKNPLAYSLDLNWYTKVPPSSKNGKVKVETRLLSDRVRVNETVRMEIVLQNLTEEGVPMSMAEIGIPAGLELQAWQLKELQEKNSFDFYEIINGKLALYYRGLRPNEKKIINLDLKAQVKGNYTGAASSAYLYYTEEDKIWEPGESIRIE